MRDKKKIRIHMTNINGDGAKVVSESLVLSMIESKNFILKKVYLSTDDNICKSLVTDTVNFYRRYLPDIISRFLECTVFGYKFNGSSPLLVLGDMPLRCTGSQYLFLQNTLMFLKFHDSNVFRSFKYKIIRYLFKINLKYVDKVIVQTDIIKSDFIKTFPSKSSMVEVIKHPIPLNFNIKNIKNSKQVKKEIETSVGLKLFYPARCYPHKNHKLLSYIKNSEKWPVEQLTLTIAESENPNIGVGWIECCDFLASEEILRKYLETDALLYLSKTESLGLPLIEAMSLGLPIIAPNERYVNYLCGSEVIYYENDDIASLEAAVRLLNKKLTAGWAPDWKIQLENLPDSWSTVAEQLVEKMFSKQITSA